MSAERAPSARAALQGEYELIRELGVGGTAVVYLARKRNTGEEVAIKLIRAAYLEDDEALARFEREARFASRLDHPNVVPIREVLPLGGGGVALIMTHVAGRTLKQFIRDERPLSADVVERILRDVTSGLNAAHRMDIIHRDVKPENIFVDESGRALLADFGLARSTNADTHLTMTGVAIGTPTYMPPEQIDGGVVDARGDIYSLGLVAWEMLSGRRPWDGDSLYALLYHQKHDYLPDVRELRPDLPDRLSDVIATAIEKEPEARWQTLDEMLAALDGVIPARRGRRPRVASETIRIPRALLTEPEPPLIDEPAAAAIPPLVETTSSIAHEPLGTFTSPAGYDDSPIISPTFLEEIDAEPRRNGRLIAGGVALAVLLLGAGAFGLHSVLVHNESVARGAGAQSRQTNTKQLSTGNARATGSTGTGSTDSVHAAATAAVAAARRDSVAAKATADSMTLARARVDSVAAAATARTAAARIQDVKRSAPLSPVVPAGRTAAPLAVAPRTERIVEPRAATPQRNAAASQPAAPVVRAMIVTGGMHTCLIAADGKGYCWGANSRGQLGANASTRTATPVPVGGDLEFTMASAGLSHSCAIARGGAAWCWGENDHGQLGDRSGASHATPARVADGHAFRAIAAGASHSCGLDTDGIAWCWGAGSHGQLGNGSNRDANTPVAVGSAHFAAIAAGWNFTCALDAGGRASCWGDNAAGQLGTRDTLDRLQPVAVAGDLAFVAIAAGNAHACGVTAQGDAYCWGRNSSGQLGDGTTTSRLTPARVKSDAHFASITAGAVHTCAVDGGGQAFCWGLDSYGQLGDGASGGSQLQPVRVTGGHDFASLRAFGSHTCGTTPSGDAFCWGYNLEGQLGDGSRVNRSRPVYLEPPSGK